MPENPDCVIVVSRRRSFGIPVRPLLAIRLRDLAHLGFAQSRPAFGQCVKALSPIIARARFDAQVIIEVPEMNGSGLAKCHFGRHLAVAVASALSMLFEEFSKLRFGHAEM